ncbi:MAG: hypothetical protein ACRD40_13555 [Candidatus Acidiferrales bacterium]
MLDTQKKSERAGKPSGRRKLLFASAGIIACVLVATLIAGRKANAAGSSLPNPVVDEMPSAKGGNESVVFAGGCFWGIQAVF